MELGTYAIRHKSAKQFVRITIGLLMMEHFISEKKYICLRARTATFYLLHGQMNARLRELSIFSSQHFRLRASALAQEYAIADPTKDA